MSVSKIEYFGISILMKKHFALEKLCTTCDDAELSTSALAASNFETEPQTSTRTSLTNNETRWKPLLLIIPLRLGLSEINPIYFEHLKVRKKTSAL